VYHCRSDKGLDPSAGSLPTSVKFTLEGAISLSCHNMRDLILSFGSDHDSEVA
jgi:hypothetical protein